jgi:Leucine-rich repeat (LRR) protein
MVNGFKINKYWFLTFCMVLCSINTVFCQELPDAEIGLDVIQLTASLKERGLSDEAITWEIAFAREQYKERYLEIKKMQESSVQEIETEESTTSALVTTDQEIGFDVTATTLFLKEHGIAPEDLNRELEHMRERSKEQYSEMQKIKNEILQTLQPKRLLKAVLGVEDVSQSEKEALKALYDSTEGSKWRNKKGWDFSTPVTSWNIGKETGWFGIVVTNGQVTSLDLSSNNLNGSIPPEIGKLKYLQQLSLSVNNLSGSIPDEIGQLINVWTLGLNTNKLEGEIPPGFYNLKSLANLWIHNNKLSGSLSADIKKLSNLVKIYSTQNQLSGEIPPEIGELPRLIYLDLTYNQLSGSIPAAIGKLTALTSLYLTNNKLTGTIPPEIGLLKSAKWIYLDYNQLNGNIPVEIGQLNLNYFYLNNNLFEGTLPNLQVSYSLDIRSNKFRFTDITNRITLYKAKTQYSPQAKTDTAKTITSGIGTSMTLTMCEDGRLMPEDTYQWYKNGVLINGAINRTYTINDIKTGDAGSYSCKSFHTTNPDMSPLVLERESILLNVNNCIPMSGGIKSPASKFYTNLESTFIFETTAKNLIYDWSVTTETGESINALKSNITGLYPYKFDTEGNYIVTAIVTDLTGCTATFTKLVKVVDKYCAKEPAKFAFETTVTGLSYTWTTRNSGNAVVNTITNTTGLYTFIPELPGEYVIQLTTGGAQSCETLFSKNISVDDCTPYASCTKTNSNTPEMHRLFITLVNKLASVPNGADANSYAKKEIAALSPYTTSKETKIYNFINTSNTLSFSFSEAAVGNDVQLAKPASGTIASIDLSNYEDMLTKITVVTKYSNGSTNSNGYVRNIDFCVSELSCVSHVALVLDESGSITAAEFNKIKKQLKAFVLQQAATNDNTGSNIYVSLTGMSDSDKNTRIDFIKPTKLTNTPAILNQFNTWIDALGRRYGSVTGLSAGSDYWRSGLEGALGYSMKPNMVVMITDGCQTADPAGLRTFMKNFNNAYGSDPKSPYLYVVGIEKGFYVDENFYTNRDLAPNEDPNTNGILINTVTPHLTKSLKYLLGLPDTQFPTADSNDFKLGTYFGHTDFSLLASDDTYFSDKIIKAGIICGTPSEKDFCEDCFSFKPEPGKEYVLSAWVKEELFTQVKTYENPEIKIIFYNDQEASSEIDFLKVNASGNIIDGWQRVVQKFKIPTNTVTIGIQLKNNSARIPVYFDDIRIHPLQGSVKSFVYDPETFKLMSELDENNYAIFYEYDNEGGLVRVKKETEKGIKTIQETRSGSFINTNP